MKNRIFRARELLRWDPERARLLAAYDTPPTRKPVATPAVSTARAAD